MIIYALFVSVVLTLIRRNKKKEQIKYFLFLFFSMVVGAILFGWFMYLFF